MLNDSDLNAVKEFRAAENKIEALVAIAPLLTSPEERKRVVAIIEMCTKQDEELLESVVEVILNDKSEVVRERACGLLGMFGQVSLPLLIYLLNSDKKEMRISAALALQDANCREATIPLVFALRRENEVDVKGEIVAALLGFTDNVLVKRELERLVASEEDGNLKKQTRRVLAGQNPWDDAENAPG